MCSRCMLMRTPSVIARLYETELLRVGDYSKHMVAEGDEVKFDEEF